MNRIITYQTITDAGPIGELLAMIERRAPELMRQGGGSLGREQVWSGRHIEREDEVGIRALYREGLTIAEIATKTKWSYKTVWNVLRHNTPEKRRAHERARKTAA